MANNRGVNTVSEQSTVSSLLDELNKDVIDLISAREMALKFYEKDILFANEKDSFADEESLRRALEDLGQTARGCRAMTTIPEGVAVFTADEFIDAIVSVGIKL